jgi:hypothetical protein
MVNNQPKKFEKKGFWLGEKTLLKKKKPVSNEFCQVARVTSQPSLTLFLLLLVFHLTRIDPSTGSTGLQVDLPGRSRFNNYGPS